MSKEGKRLLLESLKAGDQGSIYALGWIGADILAKSGSAVFMVNSLGEIHLMPESSIRILNPPRCSDESLNGVSEAMAIEALVRENRTEEEILNYLRRRKPFELEEDQCHLPEKY